MSATLLLADDSITIQRVIELTFADEDVRVVVAGDGQQAIQKIDGEPPDIILADIGMPRVDGYDVASYVKQSPALRHIPVLLLTGAFEPIDETRARKTGCDGVLVKPFEPQTLVARVKELLAGSRSGALWPTDMPRTQSASAPPPPTRVPAPPQPWPQSAGVASAQIPAPPLSVSSPEPAEPVNSVFDLDNVAMAQAERTTAPEGDDVRNRAGDYDLRPSRPELPPPADRLESELDMLDAALSQLDPTAHPGELDAATASDFARDLNELRRDAPDEGAAAHPGRPSFGGWDLPNPAGQNANRDPRAAAIDIVAEEEHASPHTAASTPLDEFAWPATAAHAATPAAPPVPPAPAPVDVAPVAAAPAPPAPTPHVPPAPPAERPTLAAAFGALLAAERAQPVANASAPAALSDAAIEDVVKRVLARMTDETVKTVVLETAERLIREEIARTKGPAGR